MGAQLSMKAQLNISIANQTIIVGIIGDIEIRNNPMNLHMKF